MGYPIELGDDFVEAGRDVEDVEVEDADGLRLMFLGGNIVFDY